MTTNNNKAAVNKSDIKTLAQMSLHLSSYSFNENLKHKAKSNLDLINAARKIIKNEFNNNYLSILTESNHEIISNWTGNLTENSSNVSRLIVRFEEGTKDSISIYLETKAISSDDRLNIDNKVDFPQIVLNFKKKYYKFVESEIK